MKALEKIKESSQAIVKICQKERLSKADKERLFKLQGDIFSQIDTLTECEICGRVSDLIASITIANTKGGEVINQSSNFLNTKYETLFKVVKEEKILLNQTQHQILINYLQLFQKMIY